MEISFKEIEPIIKKAGEIILSAHNQKIETIVKGNADFVTAYDKKTQDFLIDEIKKVYPTAHFIAEEKDNDNRLIDKDLCFIIDPIDGTTNFIRDYKNSSISIGVLSKGEVIFGAILNPYLNELFTAEKGKGAFLNGERISVSNKTLNESVFTFGSSPYYKEELLEETFSIAKKLFSVAIDIRRTGSAALDFCNVACGRVDLFFESRLSPWDFAGGWIILKEAGGITTDLKGKEISFSEKSSILCGNKFAHKTALEIINN